jgi:two-component system nitrogen regulation response regulator GlnG
VTSSKELEVIYLGQGVYNVLEEYFEQHKGLLPAAGLYKRVLTEVERPLLFLTLRAVSGNQRKAAEILGMNRNTLRKKLRDLMKSREGKEALQSLAETVWTDLR